MGRELTRASAGAVGVRAVGAVFGFLFNVLLARSLGREGTGAVMFYLNFATMTGLLATGGMDVVGLREISRQGADPPGAECVFGHILSNALLSALLFSLGGWIFLFFFGGRLSGIHSQWIFATSVIILFLTAFQKSFSDWLIALHDLAASQLTFYFINRVAAVALLFAVMISAGAAGESKTAFIVIYAAGLFLAVLYAVRRIFARFPWRTILPRLRPSAPLFRDGISCGMQNAGFVALGLSPFILLGALSNISELGSFAVSQRLVALMVLVLTTISQFAMRDFALAYADRDIAALSEALTASVRLTFVSAVGIAIPLAILAPFWLLLFGRAFAGAAPVLALLSLGICAQCLGMPFQSALLATHHERTARNVTFVCAAAGIALNLLLIPRWGAEGAALGTGIGLALQSLGHAARVLKLLPVRFDVTRWQIVPESAEAGSL